MFNHAYHSNKQYNIQRCIMVLTGLIALFALSTLPQLIAMEQRNLTPPLHRKRPSTVSFQQTPPDFFNRSHRGRGSSLPEDTKALPAGFTLGYPIKVIDQAISDPAIGCFHQRKTTSRSDINKDAFSVNISGKTTCIVVCDGHGNGSIDMLGKPLQKSQQGAVARHGSESIVKTIENISDSFHNNNTIIQAFQTLDHAYAFHPYKHQGATMSCIFVGQECITTAHIGDSPIWIMGNDETFFRTQDHDAECEQERIKNEGGTVKKYQGTLRVGGYIEISRALGNFDMEIDPYLSIKESSDEPYNYANHREYLTLFPGLKLKGLSNIPDIAHFKRTDCSFILVASDGFEKLCFKSKEFLHSDLSASGHNREYIDTKRLLQFIQGCKESGFSAQDTLNHLISTITKNDSGKRTYFPDDITIVLMYL